MTDSAFPDTIPHPPLSGTAARLSPRQRRRGLVAVMASILAAGLTFGTSIPLVALLLDRRGTASSVIGLNAAMPVLATVLASLFLPRLLRRFGTLPTLTMGLGLIVVCFLLMPVFPRLDAWFLLRFLIGLGMSAHWIVSETWMNSAAPPASRGVLAGLYATLMGIGFAGGPLLLTLVDIEGWTPFLYVAAMIALAGVPLYLARDCTPAITISHGASRWQSLKAAPTIFAAVFVSGVMDSSVLSLLAIYGLRSGLTQDAAVLMLSVAVAGTIALQMPLGWLGDRGNRRALLLGCGLVGAAGAALLPLAIDVPVLLWPLLFVWGGVFVGLYTLALAMLGERFRDGDLGGANALFVMVYCLGSLVGPPLSGAAMDVLGAAGLPLALAAVCGLFLGIGLLRSLGGPRPPA